MLATWYFENKFFIYALLLHIVFFMFFESLSNFNFNKKQISENSSINVKTYDEAPFLKEKKIIEKAIELSHIQNSLSEIQKEMLSYSVEGVDFKVDEKAVKKARESNINFDRDFKEIQKVSDENKKSIFKHSQDIETLSEVYGYIKRQSENIKLMNNISNDEEELLRSKNLLLSYENYQKTLFYKILKNWKYPDFAEDWSCRVAVKQSSTGNVMSIEFDDCVDNERFRRAVKIALFKSSPLPLPNNKEIYNETLYFTFKAN